MSSGERSPYQNLLGEAYDALAPAVRVAHEAPLSAEGTMDVVHGDHFLTPLLVRMMTLPTSGTNLPVVLHVTNELLRADARPTMTWRRQIGATVLDTRQFARAGRLVEQSGPGAVEFALHVDRSGSLQYEDVTCRLLGMPLPRFMAPRVQAKVSANSTGWHVDVTVRWRGHLVCQYGGAMHPVSRS